jgi:hypothetical protein
MLGVMLSVLRSLGAAFQPGSQLLLENLALRHQLLVVNRPAGKPRFRSPDRLLWVILRAWCPNSRGKSLGVHATPKDDGCPGRSVTRRKRNVTLFPSGVDLARLTEQDASPVAVPECLGFA